MTGKTNRGNFFEDFELGQEIHCPVHRTLGEGEIASYIALCGDRTPRYCGPQRLLHPLLVFHMVIGQTVRPISLNARANLGYAQMRWLRPLRAGTTLSTQVKVVGLKENSKGTTGIVWVETEGHDDQGPVLSYVRWVMVKKRDPEKRTPHFEKPTVPDAYPDVEPTQLALGSLQPLPLSEETGGAFFFEDYAVGERVFHVDGQTVTPSDHMSFTRLFQNTARVHFDAKLAGDPLVYGGYVMSLGYAQAFNGFENRLGIVAMNGGTHANPIHAGDTLYSFTEILASEPFEGAPVGALRCRLVVIKNENPADNPEFQVKVDGRHAPSVVLDMDFWELIPKRS